jgi:sugar-specific transcriptional regulator TrmB|tara:strand:- start:1366 stop:2115 length:750 start_codon:yes stop_codon:yes gene_type:complete
MLEKYLQEIGLSDKEASVYLDLLNSGDSSASEIAKNTKIKRPTIYTVLESLSKKGLVSEATKGTKTNYQAEPPERLEVFVERQKSLLDEKSRVLKDVIPELKSIQRESGDKPIVRYYEGKEGVISSLEKLFNTKDKSEELIYFIYPKDRVDEVWTDKDKQVYRKKRITPGMKSRTVYTSTKSEIPKADDGSIRYKIDEKKYPLKADIAIYGDKVKIHTLTEKLSGIFIENKDLADTLKSLIRYIIDNKK